MSTRVDVLVVGLGPAGSRAAWAAARAGLSVLAIERRQRVGDPVQCAELVPRALEQEVPQLGRATVQTIEAMHTYIEDGACDVTPHFPGAMLDRARFDAALSQAANDAGAACRCGVALHTVEHDGGVRLSDGSRVHPRVVIGADGPRSRAGRLAGRVNRSLVEARQVTVPLRRRHAATDIFLSSEIAGGYGWLFPKRDVAHIGAGVAADARPGLRGIVARLHARLVAQGRVDTTIVARTGGTIPASGMLDPVACLGKIRVLLAGDAAGLTNPVTGAGIAAAVQSGALAGEAAAAWLAGRSGALDEYREELLSIFGAALERALARRRALAQAHSGGRLTRAAQRRSWIAYPEYWTA